MLSGRPESWRERSGHVLLTWPIDTALDGSRFVGFVMPRIDAAGAAEINRLSDPSERRQPGRGTPTWVGGFTWRYLLQTAANLALATEVLHQGNYVFGDFNDRNILVTSQARVTLIDCDSMQVTNPGGTDFLCNVGRPEYTAPELFGRDLRSVVRETSSDLFPLAVHIHQLLLEGLYPFDGVWGGAGEKPMRRELAAGGVYLYGGDRRLTPPPLSVSFGLLPPSLQDLFGRAFVTGAQDPTLRPTGGEWRAALDATTATLRACKRTKTHVYPAHNTSCPWCEYTAAVQTATQTALPRAQPFHRPVPVTPGAPATPVPTTPAINARPPVAQPAAHAPRPQVRPKYVRDGGAVGGLTFVLGASFLVLVVVLANLGVLSEQAFFGGNPLPALPLAWPLAELLHWLRQVAGRNIVWGLGLACVVSLAVLVAAAQSGPASSAPESRSGSPTSPSKKPTSPSASASAKPKSSTRTPKTNTTKTNTTKTARRPSAQKARPATKKRATPSVTTTGSRSPSSAARTPSGTSPRPSGGRPSQASGTARPAGGLTGSAAPAPSAPASGGGLSGTADSGGGGDGLSGSAGP